MTAQTAAGSGTKEEAHAGVGPALAAETRCASNPASAGGVGGCGRSVTGVPTRGGPASPRAPTAGRRGRRAAPRLASENGRGQRRGRGRRRQEAGTQEQGGCARLRLEFQYKQGPRLDRRVFPFFCVRSFLVLSSPLGAPRYSSQEAEARGRVRVGAPRVPAAGWRERAARSPGTSWMLLPDSASCPVHPAWLEVPS